MNRVKPGTLLIELLIFLALFSVIGVGVWSWYSAYERRLINGSKSDNQLTALYSAMDLIVHDMRTSPKNADRWIRISPKEIIWHAASEDIGWSIQKNKLYRMHGIFDEQKNQWIKKKRSIAFQELAEGGFSIPIKNRTIDYVEITLESQQRNSKYSIHEWIYPRG